MHARRRSVRRFSALSLAITFLLVQLGGAWHLAWKDHARCAQHGEWIDVDSAPGALSTTVAAPSTNPAYHGPLVDRAASIPSGHDHCAIFQASRVRGIAWNQDLDPTPPRLIAVPVPVRISEPVEVGFARYLLAPKQSPPC